jgi:UDP-N-acetylglucosamine:LPS N-acetylglucosamine transferase
VDQGGRVMRMRTEVGERSGPRRLLVVSADMGGGHESTAAALEDAATGIWPGVEIARLDTLDVMGPGVGRLFRRIYIDNVEHTPWLYEFFYAQLWRHRWFAESSKRFTGSWSGRRLRVAIDRVDPDVIISTYPLGSAGLAWLRRHRGLRRPMAAYVSDIAPHPFWVHRDLDVTFVVHEAALALARACEPTAVLDVTALPARPEFVPGSRHPAREGLGLAPEALVVLVSCGAYAFGDVTRTVSALLAASDRVQVVAACGRNASMRERLEALGMSTDRLRVLGWTGQMAGYVQAADVVLSNAGGAIALETLACGRALLMHRPIAAHGRANADLVTTSGLAQLCEDEEQLIAWVRATLRDRSLVRDLEERAAELAAARSVEDGLRRLAGVANDPGRTTVRALARDWPVRPSDAFFIRADTPTRLQAVGAILPLGAGGAELTLAQVRAQIGPRVEGLPPLRRRLVPGGSPGWRMAGLPDIEEHVREIDASGGMDAAIEQYYSVPLGEDGFPWEARLFRSPPEGRYTFAVKTHHALGDGVSQLGLLDRLLDAAPGDPLDERRPLPEGASHGRGAARSRRLRGGAVRLARVGTGLASLAWRSFGSYDRVPCPTETLDRVIAMHSIAVSRLNALAEATGARNHQVGLAVVAHALGALLRQAGLLDGRRPLRAMVPVATRPPRLDRVSGNWTAAVTVDLPMGQMGFRQRLELVREQVERRTRWGEPEAAFVVMQVLGHLPSPVRTLAARTVYTSRFFSTVVSYMPAARGERWVGGARVEAIQPFVPLTTGVPVTAGVLVAVGVATFGIVLDAALLRPGLDRRTVQQALAEAIRAAEAEVLG